MGPRKWLMALSLVCAMGGAVRASALPTQDGMVVARVDELSTPTAPKDDLTTEEPQLPLKMTEMDVKSEVTMRYAHTAIVTRVRNPAKRAQDATFRVLLPETAFISGFTMILDGKPYKAYVKEKEEAKRIYNEAVSQGIGAAHVATKARDSNHFTVSVNVEPNTTAVFNLTYEELLVRRNGVYNHAINLHPGSLVPKLTVTVHVKETRKITDLRVPEVRTGNEIDATKEDRQNPTAVVEKSSGATEATVTFSPDLQEQKRLMELYAEKSKESRSRMQSGNYGPYYGQQEQESPEGVLGQFVVQYDVDHSNDGEILVNNGYFVHFFAPTGLPPLNKHVVFVLDTSGSMMNRKIEQLRNAMTTILGELNPGDYFNIVQFASNVQILNLSEADAEPTPQPMNAYYSFYEKPSATAPVPPARALPENVARAKLIVSRLNAAGGTNIGEALDVAVDIIKRGVDWSAAEQNGTASDDTSNRTAHPKPEDNKTTNIKTQVKQLEPMIIFLTDGEPTVGEVSPKRLISRISEKNTGGNRATIFTLAFGEDADREFLRKVSLRNEGFSRHIYEAADAALQLRDFYRQVSSPLLARMRFVYPPDQVKQKTLTKKEFRTYYLGSEIVVAGQISDEATEIMPKIIGICGVTESDYDTKEYDITSRVPVEVKREENLPLERLWVYLTIKQLLDERDARLDDDSPTDKSDENSPEKRALALALKYEFVTPLTSLVVVKPNATNAIDAESVDKNEVSYSKLSALSGPSLPLYSSFAAGGLPGPPSSPVMAFNSVSASNQYGYARPQAVMDMDDIALHLEENEEHYVDAVNPTELITTPAPLLPTRPAATPSSALEPYHLQHYNWLEPLVNTTSDFIVLQVNNTAFTWKLTKDTEAPRSSGGDEQCARATDGAAGACVYLTRCPAARHIDAARYADLACSVAAGYAGVCCPKTSVDQPAPTY